MGRPGKFDTDRVLDAALRVLERDGMRALSVTQVCKELGAPSGSLYHRFKSRDALLAELWLRSAERFQRACYAVLDRHPDPREAAHALSRYIIERAREHRAEALVLMAYRREDLIREPWPAPVRARAAALEQSHQEALRRFAERLGVSGRAAVERLHFAMVSIPVAAAMAELRGTVSAQGDPVEWARCALDALLAEPDT